MYSCRVTIRKPTFNTNKTFIILDYVFVNLLLNLKEFVCGNLQNVKR